MDLDFFRGEVEIFPRRLRIRLFRCVENFLGGGVFSRGLRFSLWLSVIFLCKILAKYTLKHTKGTILIIFLGRAYIPSKQTFGEFALLNHTTSKKHLI